MLINGLQKLTLLDFPGRTACTVFSGWCNFRCPFCQNASLVLRPGEQPVMPEEEFFSFLKKRRGLLDGVAITGGEPTLQPDLHGFVQKIKDMGYLVKVDTNGAKPEVIRRLLEAHLVDYVAMDIKTCQEKYGEVAGIPGLDISPIRESVSLLMGSGIGYEFRTTVADELHSAEDMEGIGRWLAGAEKYFIQCFKDSRDILRPGLHPCPPKKLRAMLEAVRPFIPSAALRGVDEPK